MSLKDYLNTKSGQRNARAIGVFVAFYCGLVVFTAFSQERLIYQPYEKDFNDCPVLEQFGISPQEFEGTRFYGPEVVDSSSKVVVVYHGNAGSACDRAYYLPFIMESDADAILVEYTGYSNDILTPSHNRLKQNVATMVQYLKQNEVTDFTIIGESIGTGPAILHASLDEPKNLILITPFTDLKALARHHYWYFPTGILVDNAYDNVTTLSNYSGPRTLIHGTEDGIIPFFMSEELASLATEQTTLAVIDSANHNNLLVFPTFVAALTNALIDNKNY